MKALYPLALAGVVILSGCAGKQIPKADLASPIPDLAAEYTQVVKPELSGKRIVITSFGVEYQTRLKAFGSSFGSTSSSTAVLNLAGVKPETMQSLADEAHARLVKDLTAAGYEVVDTATLEANEDYQALKKRALAPGAEITVADKEKKVMTNKSVVYAPRGLVFYRPAVDEAGPRVGTLGNMFSSLKNAMSPNKNLEADIAKALKANVLKVHYVVGFGSASASASGGYTGSSANSHSTRAKVQLNLLGNGETRLAFRVPGKSLISFGGNEVPHDGHAIVSLGKDFSGDNNILAGDVYNSTSAGNRAGNALSVGLSALNALAGGGGTGTSNVQEFTAPADDALYGQAVRQHLNVAGEMLVYRLKQGK